jgi:hypothetical protein
MQLDLARIYFPENIDEPIDFYQDKHFIVKQYFFQKSPIPIITDKKIEELNKLHDAFQTLYPEIELNAQNSLNFQAEWTDNFSKDFYTIQNLRTKYRTTLVGLQSAKNSAELLMNWYDLELVYAKKWATPYSDENEKVQLNQDVNAMEMLESLRNLAPEQSTVHFTENFNNLPHVIQNEMYRLAKFVALASLQK